MTHSSESRGNAGDVICIKRSRQARHHRDNSEPSANARLFITAHCLTAEGNRVFPPSRYVNGERARENERHFETRGGLDAAAMYHAFTASAVYHYYYYYFMDARVKM
jgi:hypothetical protein